MIVEQIDAAIVFHLQQQLADFVPPEASQESGILAPKLLILVQSFFKGFRLSLRKLFS